MKPAPFRYHAPSTLAEALDVLAEVADEGKVLAGGQSLIPILSMRLAAPAHLVDINRLVGELGGLSTDAHGVRVGALATHRAVEHDPDAAGACPLLRQALRHVAHPVIRNRGTVVGSLAHADPAGEMPAVLALLGGTVEAASVAGSRTIPAAEFFTGPLETSLAPGEMAVTAQFPVLPDRTGTAFVELARRHGDYAICGVAAMVSLDEAGAVGAARAAYVGLGGTPLVLDFTDDVSGAGASGGADFSTAAARATASVEPDADIHATAEYRRHLAGVLTVRALTAAADAAGGGRR